MAKLIMRAACAAAMGLCAPAFAQDADTAGPDAEGAQAADGRMRYDASYFAQFNPVTALDMVQRTPGFTLREAEERRGFSGVAGNVLINGERPSTKNGLDGQLTRIAAANVARIEVLRGGAARLEVRGQSVVANVVLVEGAGLEPTTTYRAELRNFTNGVPGYYLDGTHTFRWRGLDVSLYLQIPPWRSLGSRYELLVGGDNVIRELRDESAQEHYRDITGSIDVNWSPTASDTLNFRLHGYPYHYDWEERSRVTDADGNLLRSDFGQVRERDAYELEAGGDWEHAFSQSLSFKLVGLQTMESEASEELYESITAAGARSSTDVVSEFTNGESIVRGAFNWSAAPRHTLELGAEGAFNFLDNELAIFEDDGTGPVAVDLPVANTRVEEVRGELFVTDIFEASENLSLEFGLALEASDISQSGDAVQERSFFFAKPRFQAAWSLNETNQLRLTLERDVAQLEFDEFASSVSVSDDSVDLGNPNLEPERTWRARGEWERRFSNDAVITLSAFYDHVEFVQDVIPIAGRFDGPGNLGDGTRVGIEIDANMPLDFIGLSGAVVETQFRRQHTRVDDPTTGESRSFSGERDWTFDIDFRQDFSDLEFAWGFDWHIGGAEPYYRLRELRVFEYDYGDLDLFVETTRIDGVTLRLGVDSVLDQERRRNRVFYVGDRSSGVVDFTDIQYSSWGQFVYLRASGTF